VFPLKKIEAKYFGLPILNIMSTQYDINIILNIILIIRLYYKT